MSWWRTIWGYGDTPSITDDSTPIPQVEQTSSDPDWVLAKRHIRERLVSLRRQLETPGLSHDETEGHRYAIIELEGVLNFQNTSKMLDEG